LVASKSPSSIAALNIDRVLLQWLNAGVWLGNLRISSRDNHLASLYQNGGRFVL
jgi:hypothetical protein